MTDEGENKYVTLEDYRTGIAAALTQGKRLGILAALTDLHKDDPEIKLQLLDLRAALGEKVSDK